MNEIDNYIEQFDGKTKEQLNKMRSLLKEVASDATERMAYKMPAIYLHGNLVYYAGYKTYIGFYPFSEPIVEFKDEIAKYEHLKGTIKFPLDKPLPKRLIKKIVNFRIDANMAKVKAKKKPCK